MIKENEMGGTYNTRERDEKDTRFRRETSREKT
jgi:hypothetical protein